MIIWQILMSAWTGVLIFWVGYHEGKKVRVPKGSMCSCGHTFGFHRNRKECNKKIKIAGYLKDCGCQHYDGPLPAEEYLKSVNL